MDAADIVIIGAGAGAKLVWGSVPDRSVAVVERELVGGYCPFYACVPSKAMLRSARVWRLGADEQFSGLFTGRSDATAAYRQAVARRERIVHDRDDSLTAAALQETGARLLRGTGRVVQPRVVEVDGTRVEYRDLVLNTGSTPLVPEVPGLDTVPTWTSEQAMSTSEQPRSVAVIGGGPVGCELAYVFAVLGSQVTVIQRNARLIPREEPEASESMAERLTAVGVRVLLGQQVASAQRTGAGARLTLVGGNPVDADPDRVVLAAGRRPRTAGLGLEALGLDVHPGEAIKVDERCRVVGPRTSGPCRAGCRLPCSGDRVGLNWALTYNLGRLTKCRADGSGREPAQWRRLPRVQELMRGPASGFNKRTVSPQASLLVTTLAPP
jgi:pyruvate/2-oxoglutarate dehydrogenase complex dihydrolipoamide dehydrogenase (E3) component